MDVTLAAETRPEAGSRPTNRLRGEGKVPGVVYGLDAEPMPVMVSWPELRRALSTDAGANTLITLEYDGRSDLTIVKDLQRDPVRRSVLHIDFLRVDPDEVVDIDVPIVIVGEAKEVENDRGIAEQSMKSITVRTKPANIPSHFEVDITELTVGTSITVSQLVLPDGVTTEADPDAAVVSGVATRFSEEAELGEGEEGEGEEGEGEEGAEGEGAEASGDAAEGGE